MNVTISLITLATMLVASLPVLAAGSVEAGKTKSEQCAGCHGADGVSLTPSFPKLAGQHEDYLLHALHSYKEGKRTNSIMAGQVANLTPEDMEDLAAYFSSQRGLTQKY